ncbi:MAG: ABC transporter involved in cytochrome c biogenesis, ATPase component CcmA, partial [uncultured Gemmatimonadetes bacterium]
ERGRRRSGRAGEVVRPPPGGAGDLLHAGARRVPHRVRAQRGGEDDAPPPPLWRRRPHARLRADRRRGDAGRGRGVEAEDRPPLAPDLPVSGAHGGGEPGLLRAPLHPPRPRCRRRRRAGVGRALGAARRPRAHLQPGDAAAGGTGAHPPARPGSGVPGRAVHGPRPPRRRHPARRAGAPARRAAHGGAGDAQPGAGAGAGGPRSGAGGGAVGLRRAALRHRRGALGRDVHGPRGRRRL